MRLRKHAKDLDYHMCCYRFDQREDFLIYPIRLAEHLPVIAIPLMPGDGEVLVDVQEVFDRAYDAGPYRRQIDYLQTKVVPRLRPDQEEWVQGVIHKAKP